MGPTQPSIRWQSALSKHPVLPETVPWFLETRCPAKPPNVLRRHLPSNPNRLVWDQVVLVAAAAQEEDILDLLNIRCQDHM